MENGNKVDLQNHLDILGQMSCAATMGFFAQTSPYK